MLLSCAIHQNWLRSVIQNALDCGRSFGIVLLDFLVENVRVRRVVDGEWVSCPRKFS
jgi:hypothetical protein